MNTAAVVGPLNQVGVPAVLDSLSGRRIAHLFAVATVGVGSWVGAREPLWFDEAVTAAVVRRPLVPFLRIITQDEAGMTPYYVGLWVWSQVFRTDFGLTLFSIVGAATAIWVLVDLLSSALGRGAALAGGLLMLGSPFFLTYVTEIRAYSWMMALSALALRSADRWSRSHEQRELRWLAVWCGLLIATHVAASPYVAVALVGAFCLWPPRRDRMIRAAWEAALIVGGIAVMAAPAVIANSTQISWIPEMSAYRTRSQVQIFFGAHGITLWLSVALFVGAAALLLTNRCVRFALYWWLCCVLGSALLAIFSLIEPLWLSRYLAASLPPLVAVQAWSISVVAGVFSSQRERARVWVLLVLVLGVRLVTSEPLASRVSQPNARAAAEWVDENLGIGVLVVAAGDAMDFYHYFGYRPTIDLTLAHGPETDGVYPEEQSIVGSPDRRLDGMVLVYIGNGVLKPDTLTEFEGRLYDQYQFGALSVLKVYPK